MKIPNGVVEGVRAVLPPNWIWATGQIALILAAVVQLTLHIKLEGAKQAHAAAQVTIVPKSMRPVLDLSGPDADLLREHFPPAASDGMEALLFVEQLSDLVDGAGLKITNSEDEEIGGRRRLSWRLLGSPTGHVQVMSALLRTNAPIVVQSFKWAMGEGPTERVLDITVDFFFEKADSDD